MMCGARCSFGFMVAIPQQKPSAVRKPMRRAGKATEVFSFPYSLAAHGLGGDHFFYAPLHLGLVGPRWASLHLVGYIHGGGHPLPGRWRFPVVKTYGSSPC